jgi:hypothetical protein
VPIGLLPQGGWGLGGVRPTRAAHGRRAVAGVNVIATNAEQVAARSATGWQTERLGSSTSPRKRRRGWSGRGVSRVDPSAPAGATPAHQRSVGADRPVK